MMSSNSPHLQGSARQGPTSCDCWSCHGFGSSECVACRRTIAALCTCVCSKVRLLSPLWVMRATKQCWATRQICPGATTCTACAARATRCRHHGCGTRRERRDSERRLARRTCFMRGVHGGAGAGNCRRLLLKRLTVVVWSFRPCIT